uniref:Uncharacterized protein n=1 Tax=Ditylenchus dipsaci TaxID=166011 RepID=A0A915E3I8_9BILA
MQEGGWLETAIHSYRRKVCLNGTGRPPSCCHCSILWCVSCGQLLFKVADFNQSRWKLVKLLHCKLNMIATTITTCKLVFIVCLFFEVGQADLGQPDKIGHRNSSPNLPPAPGSNPTGTSHQEGKLKKSKSVPKGATRRVYSDEDADFYDAKEELYLPLGKRFTGLFKKSKKLEEPVFSMPEEESKPVSEEQFFSVEADFNSPTNKPLKKNSSEESVKSNLHSPNPSFDWGDLSLRRSDSNLSRTSSTSSFNSIVSELPKGKEKLELPELKEYNLSNLTSLMTHLSNSEYNLKLANIESQLKDTIFYKMKKFEAEQFNKRAPPPIHQRRKWMADAKQPLLEICHEHVVHTRQHWLDSMPNHPRKSLALTILVLYAQLYVLLQENETKEGEKKINEWNDGKRKKNLVEMHERVQLAYHFYRHSKENDHLPVVEDTSMVVEEKMAQLMKNNYADDVEVEEVKKVVEFKPFIGQDFKDILEVVFQGGEGTDLHSTFFVEIQNMKVEKRFENFLEGLQGWKEGVPKAKVEDKRTRLHRVWQFIEESIEKGSKTEKMS